jgi:hypothetical protein
MRDEVVEAHEVLQQIKSAYSSDKLCFKMGAHEKAKSEDENISFLAQFLQWDEVKRVESNIKVLTESLKEMDDQDGWTKHTDTEEKKFYYKKEEGLSCLTLLFQFKSNAPADKGATVIFSEVDYLKDWIPITPESRKIVQITPYRQLVYIKNTLSFPCSDREIILEGNGFFDKGRELLCVNMESINEDTYMGEPIERNPKLVTTHINKGFITIKKQSENECNVRVIMNIDIHLDYMPKVILNWGMRNVCGVIMDFMKEASENLPPNHKKMLKERADFY